MLINSFNKRVISIIFAYIPLPSGPIILAINIDVTIPIKVIV